MFHFRRHLKLIVISSATAGTVAMALIKGSNSDQTSTVNTKLINDSVHGQIELPSICLTIMNTPEFGRLRKLKEMGGVYYVYPGASHNRFEHCIGVGYLAGEYLKEIKTKQPERFTDKTEDRNKLVTNEDIICVQIAGLCHDLGHGPLSHAFDDFMAKEKPDEGVLKGFDPREHEPRSVLMFKRMIEKNDHLKKEFQDLFPDALDKEHVLTEKMAFIQHLILGIKPTILSNKEKLEEHIKTGLKFLGKEDFINEKDSKKLKDIVEEYQAKSFLFEIVANKTNHIDVDKFDYFKRDTIHVGMKSNFDHNRFFKLARVIEYDDGLLHICHRDKGLNDLGDLFRARFLLHRNACYHQVTRIIEHMYKDVLKSVKDIELILSDESKRKITDAVDNMDIFIRLDDSIFDLIMNTPTPADPEKAESLKKAKEELEKIEKRDKPGFIGMDVQKTKPNSQVYKDAIKEDPRITDENDIIIVEGTFKFGNTGDDPIENVRFYTKEEHNKAIKSSEIPHSKVPEMNSPGTYEEFFVHAYLKRSAGDSGDQYADKLKDAREKFSETIGRKKASTST